RHDLAALCPGLGYQQRAGPVLERGGRVAPVVLDPDLPDADLFGDVVRAVERRIAHEERGRRGIVGDRQQRLVAPYAAHVEQPIFLQAVGNQLIVVLHVEIAVITVVRADVLDLAGRIGFTADRTLQAGDVF